jgi:hypothetical protein
MIEIAEQEEVDGKQRLYITSAGKKFQLGCF